LSSLNICYPFDGYEHDEVSIMISGMSAELTRLRINKCSKATYVECSVAKRFLHTHCTRTEQPTYPFLYKIYWHEMFSPPALRNPLLLIMVARSGYLERQRKISRLRERFSRETSIMYNQSNAKPLKTH
jgi:hypothetical protein